MRMKIEGRRAWIRAGATVALSLVFGIAFAHIKNEASQFPDIEFSEARFDIVLLVGAGIIPETPVFEPDKPLSKRELAAWVGLARGLGAGGETPDTDALAEAARAAGAIDSLEGNATYADLNRLFFDGALTVEAADRTPTKAEAATFIASHLDSEAGRALLENRGMRLGDTGEVVSVTTEQGHHGNVYVVTVGNVTRPMHEHGRVANGPTDVLQWKGRKVRRSFVSGSGDHAVWSYLEAEPPEEPAPQQAAAAAPDAPADTPPPDRKPLYWLVGAVVVLGLLLFFRRRRSA
jgi:hypothetical protein